MDRWGKVYVDFARNLPWRRRLTVVAFTASWRYIRLDAQEQLPRAGARIPAAGNLVGIVGLPVGRYQLIVNRATAPSIEAGKIERLRVPADSP